MKIRKADIGKRKHISQMTNEEQSIIWRKLSHVHDNEWILTKHTLKRLGEKNIKATKHDIISTIYNSTIIEYRIVHNERYNNYDERVILRSKAIVNRNYNLNVVFSLTNKRVITVWINHVKDLHKTLDWSIYSEDMQVIGA